MTAQTLRLAPALVFGMRGIVQVKYLPKVGTGFTTADYATLFISSTDAAYDNGKI